MQNCNISEAFFEGWESQSHLFLGAFPQTNGVLFQVWAPSARAVSVVGEWNAWTIGLHPMQQNRGIWSLLVEDAQVGQAYKFAILPQDSEDWLWKADPFAQAMELAPQTASIIAQSQYQFRYPRPKPVSTMSIYEIHLGSWKRKEGRVLTYRELAQDLVPYVKGLHVTHVEFLPITEHPFYGSWGYQCTGYFAASRLYGELDDLKYLIDQFHQAGIGCILDWVPAHFPMDEHSLYQFDGTALFEHPDPKKGFHKDWNTAIFDYAKPEVRSFLLSSARFWIEQGFDGLRVDAVASMLYLNYSREDGEWLPNIDGGVENYDAMQFFRMLSEMFDALPEKAMLIAEESTSWPKVTGSVLSGGLGFDRKWDMGWMHDVLGYFSMDSYFRSHHHQKITFRGLYGFNEQFVLALSHDEVVYGKGALYQKIFGDESQKLAQLKLLFAMMIAQPGDKLIFMGMEFAQTQEWNHDAELMWELCENAEHQHITECYSALNELLQREVALNDNSAKGTIYSCMDDNMRSLFGWIRQNKGEEMLILMNCTPNVIDDYIIGIPTSGEWQEIFSTAEKRFGGNHQNLQKVQSKPVFVHHFENSIAINMTGFSASFWKRVN